MTEENFKIACRSIYHGIRFIRSVMSSNIMIVGNDFKLLASYDPSKESARVYDDGNGFYESENMEKIIKELLKFRDERKSIVCAYKKKK